MDITTNVSQNAPPGPGTSDNLCHANTYRSSSANYGAGLRVLDVSSIPSDPTGAGVCEAGFFDIHPEDDTAEGGGIVAFTGTWSSYAYFKSGFIYINTIERGSFVVKMTSKACA